MKETASSKGVKTIPAAKAAVLFDISILLPRRDRSRCPATMLATNRTDSVIGRIMFLDISIITIKFIRGAGVPCGVR